MIEYSEIDAHAWQPAVISQGRKSWNLREIARAALIFTHPSRAFLAVQYWVGFLASKAGMVQS